MCFFTMASGSKQTRIWDETSAVARLFRKIDGGVVGGVGGAANTSNRLANLRFPNVGVGTESALWTLSLTGEETDMERRVKFRGHSEEQNHGFESPERTLLSMGRHLWW
jgi:hypothetical protein